MRPMEARPPGAAGAPADDARRERDALLRDIAAREARALALRMELRAQRDEAGRAAAAAMAEAAGANAHVEENAALRAALAESLALLQERDAALRTLLASSSWRAMAPLRTVLRRLRSAPPPVPPAPAPSFAHLLAPRSPPPAREEAPADPAPAGPGPVELADQRILLGLDLPLPRMAVAVVALGEAAPGLRRSVAVAAERLEAPVALAPSLAAAFGEGAELALCCPGDAALDMECLRRLAQAHLAAGGRAILEAAAFPDESPRPFDPMSFEIPWLSAHGWALPQAAWAALGAPDPQLPLAAAAMELGRRARAAGFLLRYVPHALLLAPPAPVPAGAEALRWPA